MDSWRVALLSEVEQRVASEEGALLAAPSEKAEDLVPVGRCLVEGNE